MNKAVYYKTLFILSGTWNIVAGIIFGLLYLFLPDLSFFGFPYDTNAVVWVCCYLMLVEVFGFMYVLVGLDIRKNHLVISSGMLTKFFYFCVMMIFFLIGHIAWPLFVLGIVDLIFVGLFIEFFVNYKKLDTSQIAAAYNLLKKKAS
ncbi:MAG: hypothetical protein ACTSSH_03845 [Candidatus Heimdallarchaeota archaeon]